MSFPAGQCPVEYGHLAHDWRTDDTVINRPSWHRCPGVKILDTARALPVARRHHVLAELRAIKDTIARRISRWSVTGVEWDGGRLVPRRVEDFPENSIDAWTRLAATCDDAIGDLEQLRTYARIKANEVARYERQQTAARVADVKALRGAR